MKKPLIGLTGPSTFTSNCQKMIEKYFEANFINLAHENLDNLYYWLDLCDGVVVSGGVDIHPSIYGRNLTKDKNISKFDIQRDTKELKIVFYCLEKDKPMLGICRGHQLISIALGLSPEFIMDLSETKTIHNPNSRNIHVSENDVAHYVDIIAPDEFPMPTPEERKPFIEMLGEDEKRIWVNSFHHQGVFFLSEPKHYEEKGIVVIGTAPVEWKKRYLIIELMRGKNWISSQWHPEFDYESNAPSRTVLDLFKNLLNNAERKS